MSIGLIKYQHHLKVKLQDPKQQFSICCCHDLLPLHHFLQMLSSHPPCTADMSFWVPDGFSVNDYFDLVRNVGGDLVERVETVDVFTHPKTHRTSFCFRIVYRHMERTLTQEDANAVHRSIGSRSQELLGVELRIK